MSSDVETKQEVKFGLTTEQYDKIVMYESWRFVEWMQTSEAKKLTDDDQSALLMHNIQWNKTSMAGVNTMSHQISAKQCCDMLLNAVAKYSLSERDPTCAIRYATCNPELKLSAQEYTSIIFKDDIDGERERKMYQQLTNQLCEMKYGKNIGVIVDVYAKHDKETNYYYGGDSWTLYRVGNRLLLLFICRANDWKVRSMKFDVINGNVDDNIDAIIKGLVSAK